MPGYQTGNRQELLLQNYFYQRIQNHKLQK